MCDEDCHAGHHGGWESLLLPSPLSLYLQQLQLGRCGAGHTTGGVAGLDQPGGQYSQHWLVAG